MATDDFHRFMKHDLNGAASVIASSLQFIGEAEDDRERQEWLFALEDASLRMGVMLETLRFVENDTHQEADDFKGLETNLGSILAGVLRDCESCMAAKELIMENHLGAASDLCVANGEAFRRLFRWVLVGAFEASPLGGRVQIESVSNSGWEIIIRDQGIGFCENFAQRMAKLDDLPRAKQRGARVGRGATYTGIMRMCKHLNVTPRFSGGPDGGAIEPPIAF